jgi:ABC-type transport system involved in multi-copper enzyme maturation permease subunit
MMLEEKSQEYSPYVNVSEAGVSAVMGILRTVFNIARLTIQETQRRRLLRMGSLMAVLFLLVFGVGFHLIYLDLISQSMLPSELSYPFLFLTLAGLYSTNFLVIMVSILISVASISGEVESHTIDSLITKPIRRWEIVLGKWLGFAAIILVYVLLLPGGILLIVYLRAGLTLNNVPVGLALIYLEGLVGLSISLLGGTRLSTLANGALAFMLYGIAFVGGWVETIGALLRNETAVDLGIVASLVMPSEILWKKASAVFEPRLVTGFEFAGPFSVSSQPSTEMIIYAILYAVVLLLLALWSFSRRDL